VGGASELTGCRFFVLDSFVDLKVMDVHWSGENKYLGLGGSSSSSRILRRRKKSLSSRTLLPNCHCLEYMDSKIVYSIIFIRINSVGWTNGDICVSKPDSVMQASPAMTHSTLLIPSSWLGSIPATRRDSLVVIFQLAVSVKSRTCFWVLSHLFDRELPIRLCVEVLSSQCQTYN
jgi:hypothetical protein